MCRQAPGCAPSFRPHGRERRCHRACDRRLTTSAMAALCEALRNEQQKQATKTQATWGGRGAQLLEDRIRVALAGSENPLTPDEIMALVNADGGAQVRTPGPGPFPSATKSSSSTAHSRRPFCAPRGCRRRAPGRRCRGRAGAQDSSRMKP